MILTISTKLVARCSIRSLVRISYAFLTYMENIPIMNNYMAAAQTVEKHQLSFSPFYGPVLVGAPAIKIAHLPIPMATATNAFLKYCLPFLDNIATSSRGCENFPIKR